MLSRFGKCMVFSTHSWNVGVGANCAGRNSHHRAYRLANQFRQCACRTVI